MKPTHVYEVRPRKDKRGVDLISDALPFGRRARIGAALIQQFGLVLQFCSEDTITGTKKTV